MRNNNLTMSRKKRNIYLLPIAGFILLLVIFNACSLSQSIAKNESEKTTDSDSVKEFVPLHPPVVNPHSWKNAHKQ